MGRRAVLFPGQGSQRKGMGAELFARYREQTALADEILGYSIERLCLEDPERKLGQTQYTQPALFVVNAMTWWEVAKREGLPDFFAGHSLGEYNALLAAGCIDFPTGLRLIKRRGELMGQARNGGMLAIIGIPMEKLKPHLERLNADDIDIANHNGHQQIIVAGPNDSLKALAPKLSEIDGVRCVPLAVSAAFHSRYMQPSADAFAADLTATRFAEPRRPVLSGTTAQPVTADGLGELLTRQLREPVRWFELMHGLRERGVTDIQELGPGRVLKSLWAEAAKAPRPVPKAPPRVSPPPTPAAPAPAPRQASPSALQSAPASVSPRALGSSQFRRAHGVRLAYASGAMFRGIASARLVIRMARAGLMSFLGTGGMPLPEVASALDQICAAVPEGAVWGANFLHTPDEPDREEALTSLYLERGVDLVEASAFMRITPAIVRFRFSGSRMEHGQAVTTRRVIAKVSRPEVARLFMAPAPDRILRPLVASGQLSAEEAEVARRLPIAQDICVEADSGGHTDGATSTATLPIISRLRDAAGGEHRFPEPIRVGAAGGLGTPEAAAAAFALGADFIVTGSINQCTVEADTSDAVKDILATVEVGDVAYAPAGDMFELGAKVQVVRGKGTLFPARANKLYRLYQSLESLDAIDSGTRASLERHYFRRSLDQVWQETRQYLEQRGRHDEIERALRVPRHKMVRVFVPYFVHSIRSALAGNLEERSNFQIHCGPAMGSLNALLRGTDRRDWRSRHVDELAELIMDGAASVLQRRVHTWRS
ncbi:MAG: ACP S-malonyltransferase [Myxococcota bacterium]